MSAGRFIRCHHHLLFKMKPTQLRGIVPPLVTPLADDGLLDHAGLERLVEHVLAGGVHGLFLLGTTGEGPALPYGVRRELVTGVCKQVDGRVPVLVSVTDTVVEESISIGRHAKEQGAAAMVIAPPYYFPMQPAELTNYVRQLVDGIKLPFYLYNIPSLTKTWIGEDVVRACRGFDGFLGLKDSSGDLQYFKRMRHLLSAEHSLFMGPEELLIECLLAGGDGGVSGGANAWPELYTEIFKLAEAGDWAGARRAQARVLEVSRSVYSIGGYGATVTKALKTALDLMGVCGPAMSAPMLPWPESQREILRGVLADLNAAV
jgi:2-dehydro-3-deoxy-D-pentonate aldolase